MDTKISKLGNETEYIYKQNAQTPRMAFCLNLSINDAEERPGIYSLMARLLHQGTKKYNSEELANEFEKYARDFSCDLFPNFLRVKIVCLNEDVQKALELAGDVLKNSTFDEVEKEKIKLKGEITADLDSPRTNAIDAYYRKLFENHYYSSSLVKILENIDSITKNDVVNAYINILNNSKKSLAIVGALDLEEILPFVEETLGKLPVSTAANFHISKPELDKIKTAENSMPGVNQAHIIKGWLVPSYGDLEYPAIVLLNIMLGACGLSSRLFLELRDKKGLAYVVRSSYETHKLAGNFMIYIATEPNNIETCLAGFNEEIEKIKTIPVSEQELAEAKTNVMGKYAFLNETNIQQACGYAKYGVLGLGFNYLDKIKEQIMQVTSDQILRTAQKCFSDEQYVISIVKP